MLSAWRLSSLQWGAEMSGGVVTLGDAGDDASYDGAVYDSPVSLDYFRQRFAEFQQVMQAMDESYRAGIAAYFASDPPDENLYALLMEYESKAADLKATAEAMNTGASIVNAMGGRMPVLSIPATLGALPVLLMSAAVTWALSRVSGWIDYARGYTAGMADALALVRSMPANASKPEIEAALSQAHEAAVKVSDNALTRAVSQIGSASGIASIVIIGGLAFLAWRAFGDVFRR